MGTSASDNIAIAITTSAELSGTRAARNDLGALGQESAKVTQQFDKTNTSAKAAGVAISGASKQATGALGQAQTAATGLASSVQFQIGAFEALGKKVDVGNAAAVQGYRAQGDALSANLVKLGATDAEMNRIGQSISKVERAAGASMLNPASPQAIQLNQLPSRARTAANGLGILAQAASTGTGSLAGMATAAGNLATGLAQVSRNAKIAASASVIGLLIQLGALAYGAFDGWRKKTKELNSELADLASKGKGLDDALAGKDLAQRIEQINRQAEKEIDQAKEINFLRGDQRGKIIAQILENRGKEIALANTQAANEAAQRAQERADLIANGNIDLTLAQERIQRGATELQLAQSELIAERDRRRVEIERSFERRSASGEIIALGAAEIEQATELHRQNIAITQAKKQQLEIDQELARRQNRASVLQGSDKLTDRVSGRLEEIEIEREAEIRRTGDVYNATLSAEQKKRALYRETMRQAADDARTIIDVLNASHSKGVKAFAAKADSIRRFIIGAQAAEAGVEALIEGGKAIGSLAVGDFRGAALHGAAALSLTKAAAIAGQESLGGGRAYTSDKASGVGGPTFAPKEKSEGSPVVVNLFTSDPYGRENIMIASYQLQRSGITKRPIYVPPTTALRTA